jgi:LPXTG-motif cell wall-anchored protein
MNPAQMPAHKRRSTMKNYLTRIALVAIVGIAGAGIVTADQWDKKTVITIDEPMQLPNATLQPGTYVMKLHDSPSDRHVVQVYSKDGRHLITTILAIPNMRLRPTGKSVFAFWEVPAGQPKALRAWFYPGDNFGQEFAYPKEVATQITATNSSETVPVNDTKPEELAATEAAEPATPEPAPAAAVAAAEPAPAPAPVEVAAAPQAPPPPPAAVSEPAPAPAVVATSQPEPPAQSLPQTASNMPLIGLMGLLALAAAFGLKFAYYRS